MTTRDRAQITINLTHAQLEQIDAIVSERKATDEYVKRADVIRAIVEVGLRWMAKREVST